VTETTTETPSHANALIFLASVASAGLVMAAIVLFTNGSGGSGAVEVTSPARIAARTATGWQVPDFSLETLEGETVSLSDYRGQVVFLNFWATWCEPCQREMPAFEAFMASDRTDAVILAVNNGESVADVQGFVDLFSLENLPILMDSDNAVADGLGVLNLPVTYVIDGDGVMQDFKLGEMTSEDIEQYISSLEST